MMRGNVADLIRCCLSRGFRVSYDPGPYH